jgi:hypothetical protein
VSEALAPPFLVASLVLCVAGLAKFRAPETAAGALGLQARIIRAIAVGEVALGTACLVHATRVTAAVLAAAYVMFAGVAAVLAGRRVACGCFGGDETPVSGGHAILSAAVAVVAAAAAFASPRGIGWLASQPGFGRVVLAVGVAGATYAVVLAYTAVPRAWAAWSGE